MCTFKYIVQTGIDTFARFHPFKTRKLFNNVSRYCFMIELQIGESLISFIWATVVALRQIYKDTDQTVQAAVHMLHI